MALYAGFHYQIQPQQSRGGDFVVNRQAWPCIQERHDRYLCDTIRIRQTGSG